MSGELGKTGKAIWDSYGASKLDAGAQALIREFARMADTLDRLDDLVTAKHDTWASLMFDDMGEVHLSVDKLLDERRNHALALKQLHGEIRQAGIKPQPAVGGQRQDEGPEDMLAKLRKDRERRERQSG